MRIREMKQEDWEQVSDIYMQGIRTKRATFQSETPSYADWDKSHLKVGRLVSIDENGKITGWVALSPTSSRCVYRGVAEVSIYIAEDSRGMNVGTSLLEAVINCSEEMGIWTLQSGIFEINESSIALHIKCGFRMVGYREKVGCDQEGIWHNTVLMERRSKVVGVN
ncbi:MAG: GCN5-related N-acetyltransferase [Herbinix sp.]|jgi:phosphinothricin acetyltransferase|nr:GCN5-related N-acetyltransferase [Herbinix sp.]